MDETPEKDFLRGFSKQLAEALRAKDEEEAGERERRRRPPGRSSGGEDDRERARSAYVELCHDDPIVSGGDGDCRRLARALVPNPRATNGTNPLALSSRLVDGVLQATARVEGNMAPSTPFPSAPSSTTQTHRQNALDPMFGTSLTTTLEGYAEIAFAIFVEGPYRCLQRAEDLRTASAFLGSFRPPDAPNERGEPMAAEDKLQMAEEAAANIVSGMEDMASKGVENRSSRSAEAGAGDASSSSDAPRGCEGEHDSMEEVFAEESDPDDYEYESYDYPEPSALGDLGFDPLQLSKPSAANQTWQGARDSMHFLLSSCSYGKLALGSISSRAWSEGEMSESLADLCFMLLLENTKMDQGAVDEKQNSFFGFHLGPDDIAAQWDRPLFLLRDRALDKNRGHDALPAYLQLLTAFLAHSEPDVMSVLSSPLATSAPESALPPIAAVGLSSLATVCTSKEMIRAASGRTCGTSVWSVCPREEIKKTILSSLGSLANIVEHVRPKKSISEGSRIEEDSTSASWIRTTVCLIPIIEYITNVQARFDFRPLFEGGSQNATLTSSDAKAIFDSGVFREMLSLYTTTSDVDGTSSHATVTSAKEVVRMQLLRTLFALSTQSRELLGYAVRVPNFVQEVCSSVLMENHLVDGILWTSIGSSLLETKLGVLKPRLKLVANSKLNAKSLKDQPEYKNMADRSILGFVTLCQSSIKALQGLKECVENEEAELMSDETKTQFDEFKDMLGAIKCFSSCLSNCPAATKMWLDSLKNKEDSSQRAMASIAELKSLLAIMPSFSDEFISQRGHKKNAGDCAESSEDKPICEEAGKKAQTLKYVGQKEYGTIVASTRASVKVMALVLESGTSSGFSLKGASSFEFSSKTD